MTHDVRRIAVFRAVGLGDLLLTVPALRALRAGFPGAEITLVGQPWAEGFARRFGEYIDRFVAFPGHLGIGEGTADAVKIDRFLRAQREYEYDLVLQMQDGAPASNRLAAELGGWVTAGYFAGDPPTELSVAALYPEDQPEVERALGLVELVGGTNCGCRLEFPLFFEDRREAMSLLARESPRRPIVGIHPHSHTSGKRWPATHYASLASEIARTCDAAVVLIGGSAEMESARTIVDVMETCALDLTGRTSLGGLGALIADLDLFIGPDSGPAHIARAVETPSITIAEPTGLPAVSRNGSRYIHRSTTPEHVVRMAEHLLAAGAGAKRGDGDVPTLVGSSTVSGWRYSARP